MPGTAELSERPFNIVVRTSYDQAELTEEEARRARDNMIATGARELHYSADDGSTAAENSQPDFSSHIPVVLPPFPVEASSAEMPTPTAVGEEMIQTRRELLHGRMSVALGRKRKSSISLLEGEKPGEITRAWLAKPKRNYPAGAVGLYTDTTITTSKGVNVRSKPTERLVLDRTGTVYTTDHEKVSAYTIEQHAGFLLAAERIVKGIEREQITEEVRKAKLHSGLTMFFRRLLPETSAASSPRGQTDRPAAIAVRLSISR